jgi:hypothetical protein
MDNGKCSMKNKPQSTLSKERIFKKQEENKRAVKEKPVL